MDTVCESEMAIKMGELGGIGIIHRYLSIEDQAEEVNRVKSHHDFVIWEHCYCSPHRTSFDSRRLDGRPKRILGYG